MSETRYLISETAKLTQVEPHVLRFWEEELDLAIKRNEMGHRYYTEKDIQLFQNIKELKRQGLQLSSIKKIVHEEENKIRVIYKPTAKKEDSKKERFFEIMERIVQDTNGQDERESRYRRLDEAIRRRQQSRKMVAATEEKPKIKRNKTRA